MPPSRRAILLSSGALIAGTTGAVVKNRAGSSETGSQRPPESTQATQRELADQKAVPDVTGAWSAYKHDAANTGHAPETTGPHESVQAMWSKDIDQAIYSSSAVVDGRVFVGTYSYDAHAGSILAFDAATGEQLWSVVVEYASLEYSSPAVVDGTVYHHTVDEGGTDQQLFAFDAETGETEWAVHACSMTGSPTVVDGTLYHSTAGLDGGVVARETSPDPPHSCQR